MENSKSEVDELRQLVAGRGGRHYSPELKARVIAYAERRYTEGVSAKQVSDELGVNVHTLGFWRERKKNAKPMLRPVRVIDETSDARIVLLVRNGIRVEGLSVEQLVEVLRQVR
jgi:transposase-like protein